MTIQLIIFDVDGTLVKRNSLILLPGVREFFQLVFEERCQAVHMPALAIATNQGGVGMRYWMEKNFFGFPGGYPSEVDVVKRMNDLVTRLCGNGKIPVYICFRYQDRKGKWSPVPPEAASDSRWSEDWRKPGPGMLRKAMEDAGVASGQTLFIGDRTDDEGAAKAAGCSFAWARDFFTRDWNDCKILKEVIK